MRGRTDGVDERHEVVEPLAAVGGFGVGVLGAVFGGPGLRGVGHKREVIHYVHCAEGDAFVCFLGESVTLDHGKRMIRTLGNLPPMVGSHFCQSACCFKDGR